MKNIVIYACLLLFSAAVFAETKTLPVVAPEGGLKASGPVKVFTGPEGEEIVMIETNESKFMLVQFKNIGGIEGTKLYNFEEQSNDKKEIWYEVKRGSKKERRYVLSMRNGVWTFFHPTKNSEFQVYYSKDESKKLKAEDVINAYKP